MITALETAADGHLTWGYVRDRVRHENEKLLKTANGNSNNALFSRKNGQNDDDKKSNKSDKNATTVRNLDILFVTVIKRELI